MRNDTRHGMMRLLALALLAAGAVEGRTLQVGPGKAYAKPMDAADDVQDGDTVLIAAGDYNGEVAIWEADNLVLRGSARYARLKAPANIPNGKAIWVFAGNNITVENVEFYGAKVPDENGAGIRLDGRGATIRHCYFHDNEDGILGGEGNVLIEHTEFANNGYGDGQSHNLYILEAESFTMQFCNTHHAKIGHNIKTRAKKNFILYNRIFDGPDGTASYEVDIPNGGTSYLIGNVIQQGPETDNPSIVAFGEEGLKHAGKDLYVANNTFVNDRPNGGDFVYAASGSTVKVINNIFTGPGRVLSGPGEAVNNLVGDPGFLDRANYDYRIGAGSAAVNKGVDPGSAAGFSLVPLFQYSPVGGGMARPVTGALDQGAYEAGTSFPTAVLPVRRVLAAAHRSVLQAGRWWYPHAAGSRDALGALRAPR